MTKMSYGAPVVTDQGSVVARTLGQHKNVSLEAAANFRLVTDTASALESADGKGVGTSINSISTE